MRICASVLGNVQAEGTNVLVLGDTFFSQIMHTFYDSVVEDLVFEPSAGD